MDNKTTTEQKLEQAVKSAANYRNVQLEGGEGYNPHDDAVEALSQQLSAEKRAKVATILSGESLAAERAWFNGQGFTGTDLQKANKACQDRGYNLSDLQAASKKA